MGSQTRKRQNPINVWVTLEERGELAARAAAAGLPLSGYLRTAGLQREIRSSADREVALSLIGLHGDLGRIRGLLELCLTEQTLQAPRPGVADLLQELEHLQGEVKRKVRQL